MAAAGSGNWAGRAGKETGASSHIHCHYSSDRRGQQSHPIQQIHDGAAGAPSKLTYEVVGKLNASTSHHTAPFSSSDSKWIESTTHWQGSGSRTVHDLRHHANPGH
eukprot:TRINITY_DN69975_c0_g1_i1.p1 TRINITY_DN69975_c0_g1~~TRINITY_DN69975_c0_g1_i1.p1  ORF type:complete len:106 (-),score=12.10 TRINITY_DN69975_c0_g1_i1:171-488(-)